MFEAMPVSAEITNSVQSCGCCSTLSGSQFFPDTLGAFIFRLNFISFKLGFKASLKTKLILALV